MSDITAPLEVDELTAEWFSAALDADVQRVEVLERHSGTTGRARARFGHRPAGDGVRQAPPFDAAQRAL
jgi:hypothetical protein